MPSARAAVSPAKTNALPSSGCVLFILFLHEVGLRLRTVFFQSIVFCPKNEAN